MLSDANAMCSCQSEDDAWHYIHSRRKSFFWTDDEEHVERWNRTRAGAPGRGAVEENWQGEHLSYKYGSKTIAVPLRGNRDDQLLTIHALAQLVHDDCEFRLCKDSLHSSDKAFLALTPAEWATLERSFDRSVIDAHFLALDPDFDAFLDTAFPPSDTPRGTLVPSETNWDGGATYQPAKLDYVIVWDGPDRLRRHELERIIRRYLEPGEVGFSTREQREKRWLDRSALIRAVSTQIGMTQFRITNRALTGFVIIESNGTAAGWRIDGQEGFGDGTDVPTRRWWEFWRKS